MYDARFSGILLAVSSLPGPYGIGSLGASARRFVDFLSESGQSYWQILPLVPLGHGNSPYMSTSAFAGNPLLIDLDELAAQGLLTTEELESARWENPDRVDYDHLNATRVPLLRKAFERYAQLPAAQEEEPDLPWLADYARFAALHDQYGTSLGGVARGRPARPRWSGLPHLPPGYLLPPVVPFKGVCQPEAHPHHGRHPLLPVRRQRRALVPPRAVPAG